MPALELHHADGTVDTRELSRTQPLTIGRQSFNDICVTDAAVGAMHCRVLWNKSTFEVTAATPDGVEVNGTSVAHVRLQPGDVIRIGSLDLVYIDAATAAASASAPEPEHDGYRLAEPDEPVEVPRGNPREGARSPRARDDGQDEGRDDGRDAAKPARTERGRKPAEPAEPDEPVAKDVDDMSLFDGPVYTESQAALADFNADDFPSIENDDDESAVSNVKLQPLGSRTSRGSGRGGKPATPATRAVSMSALSSRARPGEQDIFRSPLVLGLSLGGLVLVLVTGIFWFLIGREQASRLYDRAVAELNEGQYSQSIASFEQFLQQYAGHSLRKQAERGLGKALVQKEISGATPAWKRGLEQLQAMIAQHRNEADFAELHSIVHRYAEEISLGSARSAETTREADLLTVSEDAQVILERFADPASPPTATLLRIKEARVAAVIAIGKQKLFDDGMAAVDAGLAAKQPMVALAEREKLVRAYDGFASQRRVKEALQKALDLEKSVIVSDDHEREAETTETASGPQPVLAVFHTRTRTDESSIGRVVYVPAKDCCHAVDTVTGELVWRRTTGFDPPFFPVPVVSSQPGVLLYDGYRQSLLCCQPATGKLIWSQKLDGRPRSAPLVHEGQIYLPTDDRSLCRIDLENGRLTERVTFSQNVHGPPTLSADGDHLLIPGEMAMIYALSMRPLAAASTTFTGHAAGSLSAPPLALGKLLLLCENDKSDSSNLRLWNAGMPKEPLVELTAKAFRVRGQVRESPVLRGNQLVVPSSGERLAAFSVTDEAGREGLAPVAQYRVREDEDIEKRRAAEPAVEGGKGDPGDDPRPEPRADPRPEPRIASRVPLYVALGSDGQFWAASSGFRRFQIGADSIHMDSSALALGVASQRLQQVGDQFFVGRKAFFHDAVIFSAVDRDRMVSPWRTVLGAQLLELVPGRDGGAVGLSEAGHVVLLGAERLRQGGFDLKGVVELEMPGGVTQRLVTSTLHDGRMFLAAVGDVTQLWVVGTGGQLDLNTKLAKGEPVQAGAVQAGAVQAGAVLVDEGLVFPLPGRLKLVSLGAGKKSVQDWLAPVGEHPPLPCRFLVRLAGDEVLACHGDGLLSRIQVRTSDVPHLAEAAKLQLGSPVDVSPCLRGDALLVADASKLVQQLNWRTFDQDGRREFGATVRGLWSTGSSWLVWSGDRKLHALSEGRDLPIRWSLDLKELEPAGAPVEVGDQLWIACRNGTVLAVDARSGTESRRIQFPQALTMGLKQLDGGLFAVACDGALYRLDQAAGP
jgi:outer membrane protein assembly factor BamB/TolA-binding protein